jgi:hypothetical protein
MADYGRNLHPNKGGNERGKALNSSQAAGTECNGFHRTGQGGQAALNGVLRSAGTEILCDASVEKKPRRLVVHAGANGRETLYQAIVGGKNLAIRSS